MKNIVVLYHKNCLDGFAAAYAAYHKFGTAAEYVAVNYNELPPDVVGKEVYIVDFSYPRQILLRMQQEANFLLVLDHHKTAQEDLQGLSCAVFDMSRSGAVLSWEYFHPTIKIPYGIKLIQDRDLWQFQYPDTKAFTSALYSLIPMEFKEWDKFLNAELYPELTIALAVEDIIYRGLDVLRIEETSVTQMLNKQHSIVLHGIVGLACNTNSHQSVIGNKLADISKTYGACYYYDGLAQVWLYSLRSIGEFDVSVLAKQFGGGGHKKSAGFSSQTLIGF